MTPQGASLPAAGQELRRELYSVMDLPQDARVCIYGAGAGGRQLLERLRLRRPDVVVDCFLDSFAGGSHPSGLPKVAVEEHARRPDLGQIIIVASAFAQDMEAALLRLGLLRYCMYEPSYLELREHIHENVARAWQLLRTRPLFLVESEESCVAGRRVHVVDLVPEGEHRPADPHEVLRRRLLQDNEPLGKSELRVCDEAAFSGISARIAAERPEAVLLLATMGDFDQALIFLERHFALRETPVYMLRPLLGQTWRGVRIPEVGASFVYIPKCGSTSFLRSLREVFEPGYQASENPHQAQSRDALLRHYPYPEQGAAGETFFSIVRNPYRRLASLYHSSMLTGHYQLLERLSAMQGVEMLDFPGFCDFVCSCPDALAEGHFRSQSSHLRRSDGSLFVDRIFRLEELNRDPEPLQELLGRPLALYRIGSSPGPRVDYMQRYYHDPSLKERVRQRFAADFELLGYEP